MIAGRWQRARTGALAVLLALTAACASKAAAADQPYYLALGDSITFGSHPVASAVYDDAANFRSYANTVAAHYRLTLVNASCPGETAASLIDVRAVSHGCESSPTRSTGYRQRHPLHTWYGGSQLAFAEQFLRTYPRTRLVTLGIGLNDLFVCRELSHGCTGNAVTGLQRSVGGHLDTILNGLHASGYRGTVVLLEYYATQYPSAQVTALNAAIAAAAHRHGALLADGYAAFARAAGPSGSSCAAHLLALTGFDTCDLHPSARGQDVLAASVEDALGAGVPAA